MPNLDEGSTKPTKRGKCLNNNNKIIIIKDYTGKCFFFSLESSAQLYRPDLKE